MRLFEDYSRLEFSYPEDRQYAIEGLMARLTKAFKTRCLYGLFESFWGRCLLWQRPQNAAPFKLIPPGKHSTKVPPTWSWMAVDGPIDFLEPPGGEVTWNLSVALPWKNKDMVQGPAHDFRTPSDLEEQRIIYDDDEQRDDTQIKCVIIATSKDKRKHWVVLVSPAVATEGAASHVRIGVGLLLEESIDRDRSISVTIG